MGNEIYKINENGEREWCATYDGTFSALYTMKLWWCNLHKVNFFDKRNLEKASSEITTSGNTALFIDGDNTYACTTPERLATEGINSSKLEF